MAINISLKPANYQQRDRLIESANCAGRLPVPVVLAPVNVVNGLTAPSACLTTHDYHTIKHAVSLWLIILLT